MDAAQPQEVEDYGQRYDQDAGEEEIVVVDKREAQPGGVCLPDALLPEIPAERRVRTGREMPWGTTRVRAAAPLVRAAQPSPGAVTPAPPQPPFPE